MPVALTCARAASPVSVGETFRRFGADEWDALRQRFNAGARAVTPAKDRA